ncbi:hypothetical protein AC1031_009680 [Aphanomyces cochlioides]|nr:hypothetical protein AC1031_009680 [Aphanomyces cochlioides]
MGQTPLKKARRIKALTRIALNLFTFNSIATISSVIAILAVSVFFYQRRLLNDVGVEPFGQSCRLSTTGFVDSTCSAMEIATTDRLAWTAIGQTLALQWHVSPTKTYFITTCVKTKPTNSKQTAVVFLADYDRFPRCQPDDGSQEIAGIMTVEPRSMLVKLMDHASPLIPFKPLRFYRGYSVPVKSKRLDLRFFLCVIAIPATVTKVVEKQDPIPMDPRRPTDSTLSESSQHPSPASPPQLMSESDSAQIPRPSSPTSRKRDMQYRIQYHANSPEQRDEEKRVRPEAYLALTAPESDISDDSMDPRSSSEDLTLSDENTLAIACSVPLPDGDDDFYLPDSSGLPLALTDGRAIHAESTQEIVRYEASDSI